MAKVVRPGRTFVSRMYSVAAKVKELDYFTRLNRCFRSDLYWWHFFLSDWNGISFLQLATSGVRPDLFIQTDGAIVTFETSGGYSKTPSSIP